MLVRRRERKSAVSLKTAFPVFQNFCGNVWIRNLRHCSNFAVLGYDY